MAEIKRIDYTNRDYQGYKQDMLEKAEKRLPEWTDKSENDAGVVLLELLAHQLETLSYYNDRVANEVFLSTATQRRSVMNHCKLIGYELGWQKSARLQQVFEIVPQPTDTLIPKGFQVGTKGSDVEDAVIFETVEDLIIPSGATGKEQDVNGNYLYKVEIEQGQSVENEYLGDVTTNDRHQQFKFAYSPILRESISIRVDEPTSGTSTWIRVSDFISSNQFDDHYIAEMNEYEEVYIQFGNGTSGRIPELYSKVYADYKVGGGIKGNVGANTVTEFFEALPGLVSTFNPYTAHYKGEEKEDINEAKWRGPASLRHLERFVTLPDFEEGVKLGVNGLAKIKAVNNVGNVDIYATTEDGSLLSSAIKQEILDLVNDKKIMFSPVAVFDPTFVAFDVSVDLLTYDNYDPKFIDYAGRNLIADMFSPEKMDFGKDITIAEIHHELMKIEGVRNVIVALPTGDVAVGDTSIGKLGAVTVKVNGFVQ